MKKLLTLYDLPKALELLYSMTSKEWWHYSLLTKVHKVWYDYLKETARTMKIMKCVNLDQCAIGRVHNIWSIPTQDPLIVHRAANHFKMLVHRYPLHTSYTSKSTSTICPCCKSQDESLEHFLIIGDSLKQAQKPHLSHIQASLGIM